MVLPNKPLPVLMLKEGMAVVYEAGGAEYGPWGMEGLKRHEAVAKYVQFQLAPLPRYGKHWLISRIHKKGLWGKKRFEHPADYKKRMKQTEEGRSGEAPKQQSSPTSTRLAGLLKRIFGAK